MERIAQYFDELEDLVCAVLMARERIRRALVVMLIISMSLLLQSMGVLLALSRPPLALAAVSLLIVGMLFNAVTTRSTSDFAIS